MSRHPTKVRKRNIRRRQNARRMLPYCEAHRREFIAHDDDSGEEFCRECAADGFHGDLVTLETP